MTDTVVGVEVVGVDGHGEGTSGVLNDKALEYIARGIGANHTAGYDHVLAGIVELDLVDVVVGAVPIFLLQLGNGGVGLQRSHRHFHAGSVNVVLTCRESRHGKHGSEHQAYI